MYSFNELPTPVKNSMIARFNGQKNGYKLKRGSTILLQETRNPTCAYQARGLQAPYLLTHSLIKIGNEVYRIAHGQGALIGRGSYGRVKFAENLRTGKQCALKIEQLSLHNYSVQDSEEEDSKLVDVNIGIANAKRYNRYHDHKNYSLMHYMGVPLDKVLDNAERLNLQTSERFDIAINICLEVFKLHNGILSNSGTPYAHHDIKPQNITLKNRTDVSLVDYGIAQQDPTKTSKDVMGAPIYMPMLNRFLKRERKLSRIQVDMLALKRTLYMPNIVQCVRGLQNDLKKRHHYYPFVLPKHCIEGTALNSYINTESQVDDLADSQLTAISLAAILILAKYQLPASLYPLIAENERLAKTIVAIYYRTQESSSPDAAKVLNDVLSCLSNRSPKPMTGESRFITTHAKNLRILIDYGVNKGLKEASSNHALMNFLKSNHKKPVKTAGLILFSLGCFSSQATLLLAETPDLAHRVIRLKQLEDDNTLVTLFAEANNLRVIDKLKEQNKSPLMIFQLARNQNVLAAVANSPSPDITRALLALYTKNKEITAETIARLFEFNQETNATFQHTERAQAINFLSCQNRADLYDFALNDDNYLVFQQVEKMLACSQDQALSNYLITNLSTLCANVTYTRLVKNYTTPLALSLIHQIFRQKVTATKRLDLLLKDESLSYKLQQILLQQTYPQATIKKVLENTQAFEVFKYFNSIKLSRKLEEQVLSNERLTQLVFSALAEQPTASQIQDMLSKRQITKPKITLPPAVRMNEDRANQQAYYRSKRQRDWPKERAERVAFGSRKPEPLHFADNPSLSFNRRKELSMYHSRYNPITHQVMGSFHPDEAHQPLPPIRPYPQNT